MYGITGNDAEQPAILIVDDTPLTSAWLSTVWRNGAYPERELSSLRKSASQIGLNGNCHGQRSLCGAWLILEPASP
jgi:hypothetical protein